MKSFIYIITIHIALFSCSTNNYLEPEIDKTYIEFSNESLFQLIPYTVNEPYTLRIPIQVFGKELITTDSVKITGFYNWLSFNLDTTIAIKPFTINDTLIIPFRKNTNFAAGEIYTIPLTIHSLSKNIFVSENNKTIDFSFSKESFIGFYSGNYSCYETKTQSTYLVTFEQKDTTTIINNNFWDFPLKGETIPYIFSKDDTRTITIPNSEWTDKLSKTYTISGNGIYFTNGNFEVEYTMIDMNGNIYETGKHIFTKQ